MDNSEKQILQDLARQLEKLADVVTVLSSNQKKVTDVLDKNRAERERERLYLRSLNPNMSQEELDQFLAMRGKTIAGDNYGFKGLYNILLGAQFPSAEQALSLLGYGQTLKSGRMARAYAVGAAVQQAFSPRGMSSESLNMNPEQMDQVLGIRRSDAGRAREAKPLDPVLEAALRNVDIGQDRGLASAYEKLFGENPVTSPEAVSRNRQILMGALVAQGGRGFAALAQSENPVVRGVASQAAAQMKPYQRTLFRMGGGIMMGARVLASPIGAAVMTGAQVGYSVGNDIYGPTRSAASLGYGFSYNPLNYGARISLNRSIATRMTPYTFGAFGVSAEQAQAARTAIEGMGAGGPGQEMLYNRYYGSMIDVMQETGLGAEQIAPFYESLLRPGTGASEVEKLTQMLKDDLPAAAAASRMSLGRMVDMIQNTTNAVSQNPLAAAGRTRFEISQALTSAATAGGPPGMMSIAGGENPLVVAETASRLGVGYFAAAQDAGQLQASTAILLERFLGDMNAEEFAEFRRTERGGAILSGIAPVLGLSVDDIQRIYDIGLEDYAGASILTDAFSDESLGEKKMGPKMNAADKIAFSIGNGIRGIFGSEISEEEWARRQGLSEPTSQLIRGTNFDLYKRTGKELRSIYGEEISTIESTLSNMGGDELAEFQKQMRELENRDAIETYQFLQETSERIAGEAAKDDSLSGIIDLSDDAKKYFKLEFDSDRAADSLPNERTNYGGTVLGNRR